MLRDSLLLTCLLGVGGLTALTVAGQPRAAVALGAGLLVGALNGPAIYRTLHAGAGFGVTSVGRLSVLTVAGLAVGFALSPAIVWLVVIGLAGAQFALAAAAVRELTTH